MGVIRRSVSIDEQIFTEINNWRARVWLENHLEVDFTTAINIFAEYGIRKASSPNVSSEPLWNDVTRKHLNNDELHGMAIVDQWRDARDEQKSKKAPKK